MIANYLAIMGNTAAVYVVLLIGLRLLGKKGMGQLGLTDVLFVMLVTEGAGDAMHMGDQTLTGAFVSILTLVAVNKLFEWLLYRFPKFSRLVDGIPAVLVRNGKPNMKELRRNQVTIQDLEQAGRENGKSSVSDIRMAILEVDGKVTVLDTDDVTTRNPINGLDDEDR